MLFLQEKQKAEQKPMQMVQHDVSQFLIQSNDQGGIHQGCTWEA
jgi:hypothetical protein